MGQPERGNSLCPVCNVIATKSLVKYLVSSLIAQPLSMSFLDIHKFISLALLVKNLK